MSIAKRAIRGAAWAIGTSVGARALGLAGTLLIVRYLAPAEYGQASTAFVVVATANQFSTLGVGMYVFSNPDADRSAVFHGTLLHVLTGVIALAGVYLLRGWVGPALGVPSLAAYIPGLALAALLDRLSFMPERILLRDLRFAWVSVTRALGEVSYTAVSLGLAMTGWGPMALVYGNIARSLLRAIGFIGAAERRAWLEPSLLRLQTLKAMVGYGSTVSIASFAMFAARRWDNLVIARMFGAGTMGAYNLAYNLADMPATQVGEQVTDILLPSFSRMEPARRPAALVRTCTLLGLIMFPLAVGLGAVAPVITRTFFRNEWAGIGPMLMLLSIVSAPRPIGGALTAYLYTANRPMAVLRIEWFSVVLLLGSMILLGLIGPLWACAGVGIAFSARAVTAMLVVGREEGLRLRTFLAGLVRPLAACVPMLLAVLAVDRWAQSQTIAPPVLLAIECAAGAVVYVGSALVIARDASLELLRLGRSALLGGAVEVAPVASGGV